MSAEPDHEFERRLRDLMSSSASMNVAPADLAAMLAFVHDVGKTSPIFQERAARLEDALVAHGDRPESSAKARKISVSMPEDLTAAVQQRVGRGEFSQYVTAAVARQLELDLLAELSSLLEADHGAIPEEFVAEAEAAWPDAG
ncbi:HD domain-containing protein [Nonomuraea sp. NEAU-A123]|uniref:HD domain-containing protein n=1 Tax=Nonomuraea sp. NEAU-A123 TaxID=2839649 RepID=UPI002032C920|nr:HD domain-containing protein [Nonomuraea sp. NEAU-A123]